MDSLATTQIEVGREVMLTLFYDIVEDIEAGLEEFFRSAHTGQSVRGQNLSYHYLLDYEAWYPVGAEYTDLITYEG